MTESASVKSLQSLLSFIAKNSNGLFVSGDLNILQDLVSQILEFETDLEEQTQVTLFTASMNCFPLFATLLNRDLETVPKLLRYCLLSKLLYSEGPVLTPDEFQDQVAEIVAENPRIWYEEDDIGYLIYNIRDLILKNPTLDLEIIQDEFESSGDIGNLMAILENPNCPKSAIETIISKRHFVFEERSSDELEQLIELAKTRIKE